VNGKEATHETAVALEEVTEGWIAVLRLASFSLRSTSNQESFMDRLRHAPDRSISNYLVEEILNRQTPAVQDFLVQTSIVNQLSLELCLALLGSDDSLGQVQTTLDWLEGSNLFLVPLDDRQGWYRFHHLFQQLLQRQLHIQYSEDEIVVLHKRASVWYAEQGLIEQAIEHAQFRKRP
jgi:LuxR family transcriptional regulator, maltose regulon positive regulatory protein